MQPLVDLFMQEQDNNTIIELVKDAMINTVNYTYISQQEGKKRQITGRLIDLSLMNQDNLCVIDFDINKQLPIEEIDKIHQSAIDNMLTANVGLVKTAHGGLHAYCNRNSYLFPSNRNVEVIARDNFDIDIFAQMNKFKIENGQETKDLIQNRIVTSNTTIRETKNNVRQILKYEAINDWENASHLASLRQTLDQWNGDIEMSYQDYVQQQHDRKYGVQINNDGTIEQMNDELTFACIDGLRDLDIHNYPQPINIEVSLLSIFCGQYECWKEDWDFDYTSRIIRDISQFNSRNIPLTQAKKDIIRASIAPDGDVIIRHFKSFREGVNRNIVEQWKPQHMRQKSTSSGHHHPGYGKGQIEVQKVILRHARGETITIADWRKFWKELDTDLKLDTVRLQSPVSDSEEQGKEKNQSTAFWNNSRKGYRHDDISNSGGNNQNFQSSYNNRDDFRSQVRGRRGG
ncbi:MAG: hypothetical protein EZS28_024330 [Streblomastix strix]|uniref:Uncharacterized protein n=1 Tax=Streblomastix strix TaxID=222440 RepID=A0A5J4VC90_9EUKA|nr:MAG: hypothetical protein EZS28_024330 [Streblomastix strix]